MNTLIATAFLFLCPQDTTIRTVTQIDTIHIVHRAIIERGYTVAEIDALRLAESTRFWFGSYTPQSHGGIIMGSRAAKEDEAEKVIEERVRTDMTAGLTANDLTKREQRKENIQWEKK